MSIRIMSMVWDCGPPDKAETLILLALADYCNDEGECWPAMSSIARKARMTERGAQKIIARLVDSGWVQVHPGGGRRNCNLYVVKNPEHGSPRTRFTPNVVAETPNPVRKNPEPRSPEPSFNHQGTVSKKDARGALAFFIGEELADDYIAHRKAKKAPLTERATKLLCKKLGEMDDPAGAVEASIMNGWTGVFPQKPHPSQQKRTQGDDRWNARMEAAAEFARVDSGSHWDAAGSLLPAERPDAGDEGADDGLDSCSAGYAATGHLRVV